MSHTAKAEGITSVKAADERSEGPKVPVSVDGSSIAKSLEDGPVQEEQVDPVIEKKLVRKYDLIVLPALSLIYFTNSLDRANLGNAKTAGIEKDLGLRDNQYSLMLMMFYIPYGVLSVVATVTAKRYSPGLVIPLMMAGWGICSMCQAAVKNFGGILACRIFLGICEAGFYPAAIFYCTLFYTRQELSKRVSIFYAMGFVANAFSGLIAYRVFALHAALPNWAYLFLIEGSLTVLLSLLALALLPHDVASSRYFTPAEKAAAALRYRREILPAHQGFSWAATVAPLRRADTWAFSAMALSYGVACASISNFLPTMVKRLGYSTVRANLYTIAPNLFGAVCITAACLLSDRLQQRALAAAVPAGVSMVGFVVLGTVDLVQKVGVGYFCTFLLTFGTFTPAVVVPAWQSGNNTTATGRAAAVGLLVAMQNIAGIVSSAAFRDQDAPVYRPALVTSAVFQGTMIVLAVGMRLYYARENRLLDCGKKTYAVGMEGNPAYRYVL